MSSAPCERCGASDRETQRSDEQGVTLCEACWRARADSLIGVRVPTFASVRPEHVDWLDPGRVPLRAITLIVGDPGLGKSQWTVDLAARTSRGELGGNEVALLVTAEDSTAAVVRPRLEAAGANLARVHPLILERDGVEEGVTLPDDMERIAAAVRTTGATLLVIDPLMAHLPANVNSWRDQSVRGALAPMHRLAEEYGCAVVLVAHLNKSMGADPLYRTGGSVGIPAAARSAMVLMRDPDDPDGEQGSRRVLAHFKSNYGRLARSLAYEIEPMLLDEEGLRIETSRIRLTGESAHGARDLLAPPTGEDRTERDEAVDFLRQELGAGPRRANDVRNGARAAGIHERTLKRAKAELGVESRRVGGAAGAGHWEWALAAPSVSGPVLFDSPGPLSENGLDKPTASGLRTKGANPRDEAPLGFDAEVSRLVAESLDAEAEYARLGMSPWDEGEE